MKNIHVSEGGLVCSIVFTVYVMKYEHGFVSFLFFSKSNISSESYYMLTTLYKMILHA